MYKMSYPDFPLSIILALKVSLTGVLYSAPLVGAPPPKKLPPSPVILGKPAFNTAALSPPYIRILSVVLERWLVVARCRLHRK